MSHVVRTVFVQWTFFRVGYELVRPACLSVRLYACPLVYVKNDTRELYKNFLYVKYSKVNGV